MTPDREPTSDVQRAQEVLHELEQLLEHGRLLLQHLLDLSSWTVYPAALTADRATGALVRRMLLAVRWALRLEEDMGKEPDPQWAWDDQGALDQPPASEAMRITVGRSSPALHWWTRHQEDEEVDRLVAAVRAADALGTAAVEQAVRQALAPDLVEEVDRWAAELGPEAGPQLWPRLARNIRGQCRRMRAARRIEKPAAK